MLSTILYIILLITITIALGFVFLILIKEGIKSWNFIFKKDRN
jgi:hypothetical protein